MLNNFTSCSLSYRAINGTWGHEWRQAKAWISWMWTSVDILPVLHTVGRVFEQVRSSVVSAKRDWQSCFKAPLFPSVPQSELEDGYCRRRIVEVVDTIVSLLHGLRSVQHTVPFRIGVQRIDANGQLIDTSSAASRETDDPCKSRRVVTNTAPQRAAWDASHLNILSMNCSVGFPAV